MIVTPQAPAPRLADPPPAPAPPVADGAVEVSVVIPCLNEALTVGRCIDKALASLRDLGVSGEVVVADNGSSDGSVEIAATHGARVVSAPRRGYGMALQAGIAAARGRFLVMGDADDSYDFSRLGPFVERLRAGDHLVVGNRFRGGIRPGAMPWLHRYVGNPVLSGILNLLYYTPVSDAHCGLRGFQREAYARWGLRSPGMEFASEMIIKASLHRDRISEVPVVLHPDGRQRPPHLRSFRDGWRHLRLLLALAPGALFLIPAVVLMTAGVVGAAGEALSGFGTTSPLLPPAAGLALVLGYQAFWLWAVAVLAGRSTGLLPGGRWAGRVLGRASLEATLALSIVLAAAGAALASASPARAAWPGFAILAMGGQTIINGFVLFTIRVSRAADAQ